MNLMWVHNALVVHGEFRALQEQSIKVVVIGQASSNILHFQLLSFTFFSFPLCNCNKQSNLLYKLDISVVDVSERVHRCCLEKQSHLPIDVQCKCLPILACKSHLSFHNFTCLSNLLYGVFSTTFLTICFMIAILHFGALKYCKHGGGSITSLFNYIQH